MEDRELGKRIMIIGSCGSGKSTLAIRLGQMTGLPVIHLDQTYWNPGWIRTPENKWIEKQRRLVDAKRWIIEGNYGGSLDIRLEKADTVIFLDFNRYICIYRVIKRWLAHFGGANIAKPDRCPEKIDLPFIKFLWRFPAVSRPVIFEKLSGYSHLRVIILKNQGEVQAFLNSAAGYLQKRDHLIHH